jgi:hypothetical protein
MWLLAEANSTAWLLALGIAVMASLMLSRSRRRTPDERPTFSARGASFARAERIVAKPHDLEAWEAESHDRLREWTAALDNKIVLLQQLILTARQEAAQLDTKLEEIRAVQSAGREPLAREAEPRPPGAAPPPPHAAVSPRVSRPLATRSRDEIEALAAAGRTVDEIAQALRLPLGEVELIVNLQRRQSSPSAASQAQNWHAQDAYLPGNTHDERRPANGGA